MPVYLTSVTLPVNAADFIFFDSADSGFPITCPVSLSSTGRLMTAITQPFLAKVMDLLLDTVCVVDAEGRFVYLNASCEKLFGYTREELIGREMIELVHPDDRERTLKAAEEIMRGRPRTHFENRYVRKDGRIVHIMWSARWSDSDGMRLAVARDITEIKRAQLMQSAVYRIAEAAHATDELHTLYRTIHQIIGELLPADNFYVARYDQPSDTLSFPYFVNEREQECKTRLLDSDSPLAEIIRSGRTLLTSYGSATAATESSVNCQYPNWLGAPLISQHGVMGALVTQIYARNIYYTEEDRELLEFVSTQVAAAIERKQTESRFRHMAHHDPLTDLPNRRLFDDRLDMALKRARRNGEHLALLCLDLDDFKDVNDSFGHDAGDRLLSEVAQRLLQCVRESDTVGRMGGDEFTVLLTNVNGADDVIIAEQKIRAALARPFDLNGQTLSISASIGTAVYPKQGVGKEQLFHHADADMYAMKSRA